MVVVLLALMLSISRAFNTGDMGLAHRLFMWVIICGLIAVQVLGFSNLLRRYTSPKLMHKAVLQRVLAVALSIPVIAIQLHLLKYTPILPKQIDPPLEFLGFVAPPVAIIGAIFLLAHYLLQQSFHPSKHTRVASAHSNEENSQNRKTPLSEWQRSKIRRVQADDHYLRIFSETGDFYVRGKMADAINLLEPDEGIRVHRSHWVSFRYIKELVKVGRDYRLLLFNGDSVPVSRGRLSDVRDFLEKHKK